MESCTFCTLITRCIHSDSLLFHPYCTLRLVLGKETSQWNSPWCLLVNRSSVQLSINWISPVLLHKAPHLHRRWPTLLFSAQPSPVKWHLPPITCTTTTAFTCPETTDNHPEGSLKHVWNEPQDLHHDNKIQKARHGGCCCPTRLNSPGSCATRPYYAQGRQWII